jgi:protein-L-isoaspartate(D-aspartate) O-methyltransferase
VQQKGVAIDLGNQADAPQRRRAPFAAAGGEAIPLAWTEQLAMGGRLVAPVHVDAHTQVLVVVDKTPQGLVYNRLEAVHFVPLKSGTL